MRRDAIHRLTTAATIWLVAGIGMACGGGLAALAAAVTALYFIALYGFPALIRTGVLSVSSDDPNIGED